LQELAPLTGAVMSIAPLFGCPPLWNSSRNAHKSRINQTRIAPTAVEADFGSPKKFLGETVRVRRYAASSGWRN
jgi:hypothetical protein